jgi:hypothetical protein
MKRIITFGGYFEDFMGKLTDKEQQKVDYLLTLLNKTDYPLNLSNSYVMVFMNYELSIIQIFTGFSLFLMRIKL